MRGHLAELGTNPGPAAAGNGEVSGFSAQRGAATLLLLLAVVLLGGGAWGISKTKWFHGESKRAAESTATTTELIAAKDAQSAKAGAVFAKMGEVIATLPATREKDFLGRSVGIGLSFTAAPDPAFLLEMERLKNAVLTGQLQQANAINDSLTQSAAQDRARAERALAAKQRSDLALEQAAAEARGAEQQQFWFACIALAAGVLYVWTKLSHISPLTLSAAVHDLRTGTTETNPAIAALDSATTPFQQANVKLMAWLRLKLSKLIA